MLRLSAVGGAPLDRYKAVPAILFHFRNPLQISKKQLIETVKRHPDEILLNGRGAPRLCSEGSETILWCKL